MHKPGPIATMLEQFYNQAMQGNMLHATTQAEKDLFLKGMKLWVKGEEPSSDAIWDMPWVWEGWNWMEDCCSYH